MKSKREQDGVMGRVKHLVVPAVLTTWGVLQPIAEGFKFPESPAAQRENYFGPMPEYRPVQDSLRIEPYRVRKAA